MRLMSCHNYNKIHIMEKGQEISVKLYEEVFNIKVI